MIIHSIVSPDDIFRLPNDDARQTEFMPIEHGFVELDGRRMVKRVISTNPQDYLNKKYQLDKYLP